MVIVCVGQRGRCLNVTECTECSRLRGKGSLMHLELKYRANVEPSG